VEILCPTRLSFKILIETVDGNLWNTETDKIQNEN
jgi:hypothetical protein